MTDVNQSTQARTSSDQARDALIAVRHEVAKAVVGQDAAVSGILIALLSRGHILLEGVPGVAKTLLIRAVAAALDVRTKRVQFTPDLMPGDITGSLIYDPHSAEFSFREGPVFTNLLLADEINRTPPKTQAALLESMEERQVSVDGVPRPLPSPFMVAATQNPIEYEGTYPLPEAQLDRFLLKVELPLPTREDEIQVVHRHAAGFDPRNLAAAGLRAVAGPADLDAGGAAGRTVTVSSCITTSTGVSISCSRTSSREPADVSSLLSAPIWGSSAGAGNAMVADAADSPTLTVNVATIIRFAGAAACANCELYWMDSRSTGTESSGPKE